MAYSWPSTNVEDAQHHPGSGTKKSHPNIQAGAFCRSLLTQLPILPLTADHTRAWRFCRPAEPTEAWPGLYSILKLGGPRRLNLHTIWNQDTSAREQLHAEE